MATSKEEIKHATAQARVTEDDALRTGYINGTPLEGGKIADSDPVDLFAQARHVADADASSQQQQQPRREGEEEETTTAGSKPQERQGMAAPTGGGRRLGRQ